MRSNEDIAKALDEIADLLEIDGANTFRVRAYRNAGKTLRELPAPATSTKLTALPGIGPDLAGKIEEIARTGSCPTLDDAREKWPTSLRALFAVPGLGPKRTRILHEELGVLTVDDLKRVVDQGLLASIPALGKNLEKKLKDALAHAIPASKRFPLEEVTPIAEDIVARLKALPGVLKIEAAGSWRRRKSTIGDLDVVVAAEEHQLVIDTFCKLPRVRTVLAQGDTRGSIDMDNGLQVDLRVVAVESYGAALLYFTGSKNHGIELRAAAIKQGLKLNEYGLWRGDEKLAGETEESMYTALGMTWLHPTEREK